MKNNALNILRLAEEEVRDGAEPQPVSDMPHNDPDPGTVDLLDELPGDHHDSTPPKRSGSDQYAGLKELARKDRPTLEHLLKLKKVYQETGELGGKADVSLQSILTRLFRYDESEALRFGRIEWIPDMVAFVGFFDEIGEDKLGPFLGMNTVADVPKGPIADASGELPGSDLDLEEPEIPGQEPINVPKGSKVESVSFMHLLDA